MAIEMKRKEEKQITRWATVIESMSRAKSEEGEERGEETRGSDDEWMWCVAQMGLVRVG